MTTNYGLTTNYDDENLEFLRGRTGKHQFILKDEDGNPYNLIGYSVKCQARLTWNAGDPPLVDLNIVDGSEGNSFVDGVINITIPASITLTLPNQCAYDIVAISGSLKIPLVKGFLNTLPSVTR